MSTSTKIAVSSLVVSLLAMLSIAVALGGVIKENCEAIEELKSISVASLVRSLDTLPTIDYYRTHPVELKAQLARTQELIESLQPRSCGVTLFGI